jgi:hypothetical protein
LHAYALRIRGLDDELALALARWDLFTCPEVLDLVEGDGESRFLVYYDGDRDRARMWCHVLANAGYPATPLGRIDEPEAA